MSHIFYSDIASIYLSIYLSIYIIEYTQMIRTFYMSEEQQWCRITSFHLLWPDVDHWPRCFKLTLRGLDLGVQMEGISTKRRLFFLRYIGTCVCKNTHIITYIYILCCFSILWLYTENMNQSAPNEQWTCGEHPRARRARNTFFDSSQCLNV